MRNVSSAFLDAAKAGDARLVSKAQVVDGPELISEGFSVTVDYNQEVRRTMDISIIDPSGDLVPGADTDLLAPFGTEIDLFIGFRLPDGTEELAQQGRFVLSDTEVVAGPEGPVMQATGFDRMVLLQERRWPEPYTVLSGQAWEDALKDAILDRIPGLPDSDFVFPVTGKTTPFLVFGLEPEETPADELRRAVVEALGMDLFVNADGKFEIRAVPDPDNDELVATYTTDQASVILSSIRRWSREQRYSGVVARSNSMDDTPQVQSIAWDDNPSSPTYHLGPFGEVPFFMVSEMIVTQEQADSAAAAQLNRLKGSTDRVTLEMVCNPAHEEGDIIQITDDDVKADARYILDSFTILSSVQAPMSAVARRRVS